MNSDFFKRILVWEKGQPVPGCDPAEVRHDDYGLPMRWGDYGNRWSPYGWEIDHIQFGGPDDLWNLRPLNAGLNARRQPGSWLP